MRWKRNLAHGSQQCRVFERQETHCTKLAAKDDQTGIGQAWQKHTVAGSFESRMTQRIGTNAFGGAITPSWFSSKHVRSRALSALILPTFASETPVVSGYMSSTVHPNNATSVSDDYPGPSIGTLTVHY